jgi:hypothetical protein
MKRLWWGLLLLLSCTSSDGKVAQQDSVAQDSSTSVAPDSPTLLRAPRRVDTVKVFIHDTVKVFIRDTVVVTVHDTITVHDTVKVIVTDTVKLPCVCDSIPADTTTPPPPPPPDTTTPPPPPPDTVTPPPPPPDTTTPPPPPAIKPATCLNEPVHFTRLTYQPFDAKPPVSDGSIRDAYGWSTRTGGAANVSVTAGILQGRFQANTIMNGTAPFAVSGRWATPTVHLYSCQLIRTSAPWQMSPDITGNKLWFFLFPSGTGNNAYVNLALRVALNTQHSSGTGSNQNGPSAFGVGLLGDGNEHTLEVLVQGNPLGDSTGVITIWLDGVQRIRWTGVQFYGRTTPKGVIGVSLQPTHGGCGRDTDNDGVAGPCTNYVQQDILLNHWYVSGSNVGIVPPPPPPDTVVVGGVPNSMMLGDSATITAQVLDSLGNAVSGIPTLTIGDTAISTLSGGVLRARGSGTTQLLATFGTLRTTVPITVTAPSDRPLACANAPANYRRITWEEFDTPLTGTRNAEGWMEELNYQGRFTYANGIGTGTWWVGLPAGRGPFNVHWQRPSVRNMYTCERVKLDSAMVVPNPLLKEGFWKSVRTRDSLILRPETDSTTAKTVDTTVVWRGGEVNHVFMFIPFPEVHVQFGTQTGPDGYTYRTHRYCRALTTTKDAGDLSTYTVRPANFRNLRDGRWHDIERLIEGGTPGNGDGRIVVWLDGVKICETTGVRWYAPHWAGTMNGNNLNPNSSGGTNSWTQVGHVQYEFVWASGN